MTQLKRMHAADLVPSGPAVLRFAIGAVFIGAGLQKLLGIWGGTGIPGTAALFEKIHLAPAYPLAVFITGLSLLAVHSLFSARSPPGWRSRSSSR